MSNGSSRQKRRKRSGQSGASFTFGHDCRDAVQPLLVTATDVCLWMTFFGVAVCFGGRAAVGQLILVIGAALTAGCWLLHQLSTAEPEYTWSGSEWLWLTGIVIGVSQIIPLPREWMFALSPKLGQILLAPNGDSSASLGAEAWNQLSLAPWETASGLATFVAYSMLFLVVVQRVKTTADVERTMCGVGIAVAVMAVFAQLQYFTSNGKFFWFYQHPFMTTDHYPTGCFTNRNHLAQFLALGIGPLIWCVLRKPEAGESEHAETHMFPANRNVFGSIVSGLGLGSVALTALSTLSRGGLLAVSVAIAVSLGVLWRLRQISAISCLGLVVVVSGIGTILNLTGNEASLAARLNSETGREHVWRANIAVAQDFPILGTGVGTHADAHHLHLDKPIEGIEFTHAESGYLQVMSETGFVGLSLAALFILVSLWWCCGSLRNPDTRVSSVAAAVLASLLANVAHAVADFFWYTPSCMLLLAIQLACACRLYQTTREELGRAARVWRVPRLVLWPVSCGVCVAAAWMAFLKLPATLAEPDHLRYLTILVAGTNFYADDEDRQEAQHEKWQAAIRAARLDPHNSRLQESAALAFVEWFDERQKQSDNPLPLGQLRDAIQASQFETPEAMNEWLDRAVGKNVKYLRVAMKYFHRALRESPLRAGSYVQLAELGFLNKLGKETESTYLKQAILLRPHDPEVLFAAGRSALMDGNLDQAMDSWTVSFEHSQRLREIIADLLAGQVTPEFFLEKFKPGVDSIGLLARAFAKAGREAESREMWMRFISETRQRLKAPLTDGEYESAILRLYTAHLELHEPDEAIRIMTRGLKRLPYSFALRHTLGMALSTEKHFVEAAEHLQWCADRQPENEPLQQAAAHAIKERLKSETRTETRVGNAPQVEITQ